MMASAFLLAILSVAVAVSASISTAPDTSIIVNRTTNSNGGSSTTMFLPLFLKNHNHRLRHKEEIFARRHLLNRSTSNARMPLYDDLLINGYYTTHLSIGTPPQRFALIVDTGSTVTYVPCSTCEQCGKHQDPRFQPEKSTTYRPVKCNSHCTCDNNREQCTYERQYAEMSSSSGVLGKDTISFGNQSDLKPQRAVFGCENMETGDIYSQDADGIMGFGRGDLSIVDELVKKGAISDSFSLCYGGMDVGGGAMVLGGISPPSDMVFTRSDPLRSSYYNIELSEIHVAGKKLPLNPRVFDGKDGTFLDSGTTYAYLPKEAFEAFKEAIFKGVPSLKRVEGPDPFYDDICFSGAGSDAAKLSKVFPAVEMVFGNGQKLLLSPENYLFRHTKVKGAYCLGIFQNGVDPTTLLGAIIVRNTLVTYDREHEKIGFLKTNCSDLWKTLRASPASAPFPSRTNEALEVAPMVAPAEPPMPVAPVVAVQSPPLFAAESPPFWATDPRNPSSRRCRFPELPPPPEPPSRCHLPISEKKERAEKKEEGKKKENEEERKKGGGGCSHLQKIERKEKAWKRKEKEKRAGKGERKKKGKKEEREGEELKSTSLGLPTRPQSFAFNHSHSITHRIIQVEMEWASEAMVEPENIWYLASKLTVVLVIHLF